MEDNVIDTPPEENTQESSEVNLEATPPPSDGVLDDGGDNVLGSIAKEEDEPTYTPIDMSAEDALAYATEALDSEIEVGEVFGGHKVTINRNDAAIMAPILKGAGLNPKQAGVVMQAIATYERGIINNTQEAENAMNKRMKEDVERHFGNDLGRVAQEANRGGEMLFGKKEWEVIRRVPAICNRVDFLKGLSDYARSHTSDGGVSGRQSGKSRVDTDTSFMERWSKATPLR